jgi:hypothetical protein
MRALSSRRQGKGGGGGQKVQLGIWIFVSQHKFTIVDLQKAFPVYACAVGVGEIHWV